MDAEPPSIDASHEDQPLRDRLLAIATALLACVGTLALPASASATVAPPKVVIIVGPVGSYTSTYRSQADQVAAAAQADGATVVKVYSPNATWGAVKAAVNGANLIVYLGHGNGYPNPYSTTYYPDRDDGWGLNRVAGIDANDPTGDGDNWSTSMVYCGEKALTGTLTSSDGAAQLQYCNTGKVTPAAGFVMVYANACYAPGASEPGNTAATPTQALQRVSYFSRPMLATLHASGYFATDHGATSLVHAILTHPDTAYGDLYTANRPSAITSVTDNADPLLAGVRAWLGWRSTDPYYTYAYAGDPRATFAGGSTTVTADFTPPTVVSRWPAASATGVTMTPAVTVRFSEAVTGVGTGSTVLRLGTTVVAATVTYDPATFTATLRPSLPLAPQATYSMALSGSIRDLAGNPLAWTTWSFTTARSEIYSPNRTLAFGPGTYTGYKFTSTGAVSASRAYTLASTSNAPTGSRSAVTAHTGGWYYVTAGVWAGYWVHEGTSITLK